MQRNGIVLLSLNKPLYGGFALTMLASIKANNDLPVQLICDDESLSHIKEHLDLFDIVTKMDSEDYSQDYIFDPARAKLNLYKYIEFDRAIYLDVDGICLFSIEKYFDLLKDENIHIQGMSNIRQTHWCSSENVMKYTGVKGLIRDINSSFFYIKKCEQSELFFNIALNHYEQKKIPLTVLNNKWGGTYPDELFFSIALNECNIYSNNHIAPIHFDEKQAYIRKYMLKKDQQILSLFGNEQLNNNKVYYIYDQFAKYYSDDIGLVYKGSVKRLMKDKHAASNKNNTILR